MATSGGNSQKSKFKKDDNSIEKPVFAEYLTLKPSDEVKIFDAINKAAKKQCQGAVFTLKITFDSSKTLKAGVKDIGSNILVVSMLKRVDGNVGPAEARGLRLGDVVFGANFSPLRDGCKSMMDALNRQLSKNRKSIHLQCWRCVQLCADPIPGITFPRMNDVLVRSYFLLKSQIFDGWERWNFLEIQLGYMLDDLKLRDSISHSPNEVELQRLERQLRRKHGQMSDLERNITQAKGLRAALCVRIVHTKNVEDTVAYVMRIEDVETGLQWVVHRRYSDFHALHKELCEISSVSQDVRFPSSRLSIGRKSERVVEGRLVSLEWWTRAILSLFSNYARMDPAVSRALRIVQAFLGVDRYIDCIRPPPIDDQRYVELIIFRVLANEASLLHDRCEQFVSTVKLQTLLTPKSPTGYIPMLKHIQDAVSEVQEYVLDSYQNQLVSTLQKRNRDMSSEEVITFVRRCVRRQVEAAIYLPLRRNVIKLTFPYLQAQTAELQRAMTVLRDANPSLFLAHPMVREAKSYEAARRMFRDISRAYLPADQGQLLIRAAGTVLAVYSECRAMSGAVSVLVPDKKPVVARPDLLKSLIQPVPSETTSGQATGEKRSQSVPEFSSRTESLAESNPHTLLQIDTTPIKTPINSTTSTGIVIRSPKKAIFVVPRQPPENERLEAARSLSRHIDYTDEDLALDPVATLFPSLDTEENLDGKFMRLADGARVTDLADSSLPACMHSPETKKNETTSVGDFDNAGITEVVAIDGMTATISPRLDEISILTARVYNAEESTNGVSNDTQKAPPLPSRLTQLQNTESEDRDDTPTRELKSILSDLSVQFNSVRLNTDGGGITSDDCYGIDTFDSVDNNDDDDDDNSTETSKRNDSFSDTWKTSVCITPGLPSPKSNVESSGAKNSGISTGTPAAVTGTNEERTESIPHQSAQTQAQSQAIAMSRVSIDSARGRPHLFDTESPKVPRDGSGIGSVSGHSKLTAMGADDFLPLFAYILTQSELPELLLVKELLMYLVDPEEQHGECGYYSATLEAATQLIVQIADDQAALNRA